MTNISEIRREYQLKNLSVADVNKDPVTQFKNWLEQAIQTQVNEPTAMVLSTATVDGKSSSRTVLLKEIINGNFCFFTNYNSKKGNQINKNPHGSILFYWPELERQIIIEGLISKMPEEKSDEYFNSRPNGYKISAWASPQSELIPDRKYLVNLQSEFNARFQNNPITRPSHWGGYQLSPVFIEFWQGRINRLHDRIVYKKDSNNNWQIVRLAP